MTRPSDTFFPGRSGLIPIEDVAEVVGRSKRALVEDCRAGTVAHFRLKGRYAMTAEQFDAYFGQHVHDGANVKRTPSEEAVNELDAALLANARPLRRGRRAAA